MDMKQLREQGYTLLSQLFEKPDESLVEAIKSEPFQEYWQQVNTYYDLGIPESWQQGNLPQLTELYEDWNAIMGPYQPLASPIESLYKPWTTDSSCGLSIAGSKGWLRGDWAFHMEDILKDLGFDIPEQFTHCPDHIILILELMSAMIENAPTDVQQQFASQHLDWLDDLIKTAKERNAPASYVELYQWCADFVKADQQYLASQNTSVN